MFGAAIGDIIGSRYEFYDGNIKQDFRLFTDYNRFTDDTVMTAAIASALLAGSKDDDERQIKQRVVAAMQDFGHRYPHAGYGGRFRAWLKESDPEPYGSFGNGSAMRVSAVGWLYDSLQRTLEVARYTAEVTHDHPEGIKGAQSTAAAICLLRNGKSKEEVKEYIIKEFAYDLDMSLAQLKEVRGQAVSCQDTMPKAFASFLKAGSYEEAVRNSVVLGGDTDTVAAIAGSLAEACYGIPSQILEQGKSYLNDELREILAKI